MEGKRTEEKRAGIVRVHQGMTTNEEEPEERRNIRGGEHKTPLFLATTSLAGKKEENEETDERKILAIIGRLLYRLQGLA